MEKATFIDSNPIEWFKYNGYTIYRGLDHHWYVRGLFGWMQGRFDSKKEAENYCNSIAYD